MGHDVFISYSTQDKSVADGACAALEQRGIRCWIAPRDVPAGHPWAAALVDAIAHSGVMVLILSNGANSSPQVTREVGEAVDNAIPIIPLRIEDVDPSEEMRYYIKSIHWLDAMSPPLEQHLDELGTLVEVALDRGTAPAPPRGAFAAKTQRDQWYRNPATWGIIAAAMAAIAALVATIALVRSDDGTDNRDDVASAEGSAEEPGPSDADPSASDDDAEPSTATFEEPFDGKVDKDWVWLGKSDESMSVVDGRLEIIAQEAPDTRLVRAAPTGPYEVITQVEFAPSSNFQFAGLIVQNGDGDDWLQIGRAYCDPSIEDCVGDGAYLDNIQDEVLFGLSDNEPLVSEGDLYLRLTADDNRYAAAFSTDGVNWLPMGSHEREFSSPMVGVIAHQAREEPIVARFEFVTVTELG